MFLALALLTVTGWHPLVALLALVAFGTFVHRGAFDESAAIDVLLSQCQATIIALAAGSVLPAGYITGSADVALVNTANAPGTQTTRTAAQLYADLQAELGLQNLNGFTYFLSIQHAGTGTLTLAAGSGVTLQNLTGGATTIATLNTRDFIVQVNSPTSIIITALGSRANT
jgi:hypothetical protein